MKKNLFHMGLATLILVVCVISITKFEDKTKTIAMESEGISAWTYRAAAKKEKTFIAKDDGQKIKLTYAKSKIIQDGQSAQLTKSATQQGDNVVDIYMSDEKEEYRFRANGEFAGYFDSDSVTIEKDYSRKYINQASAIKIAEKEIMRLYGEKAKDFKLYLCREKEGMGYQVFFTIFHGENNYIISDMLSLLINEYGDVIYCVGTIRDELLSFNDKLLENVSESQLNTWIKEQLQEEYGDYLKDFKIKIVSLTYEENNYMLAVSVYCIFDEYQETETYLYELK